MAGFTQTSTSPNQWIGVAKAGFIEAADPTIVLGKSSNKRKMKKGQGRTIRFRRHLPFGGSSATTGSQGTAGRNLAYNINHWDVGNTAQYKTTEGVTPPIRRLNVQDIDLNAEQYAMMFDYTDESRYLYDDPEFIMSMVRRCGKSFGLLKEMVCYNKLLAGQQRFNASGATSRAAITQPLKLRDLRAVSHALHGNGAMKYTMPARRGNAGNDLAQVESSFLVFCHTNAEETVRNLPGFVQKVRYASTTETMPEEIGAVTNFRFIQSRELGPYMGAGGTSTTTGANALYKSASNRVDVYPFIILGKGAWADVSLRGAGIREIRHISSETVSKADPASQRGYVVAKAYMQPFIENDGHIAVLEAGCLNPAA